MPASAHSAASLSPHPVKTGIHCRVRLVCINHIGRNGAGTAESAGLKTPDLSEDPLSCS